jgi:hypothetical protein
MLDSHVVDYHLREARTFLAKAATAVRKSEGNYWERTEFSDEIEMGIQQICEEITCRRV